MAWTDEAIMVSVMQDSKKSLCLDVLTKMRGRCRVKVMLEGSNLPPLYPGCTVKLAQQDSGFEEIPTAQLLSATGGLENADTNIVGMIVLHSLRKMLEVLLPPNEAARSVYKAASQMIPILRDEDSRWPLYYLIWEMEMLSLLGHAGGLERCKGAFKHGEAIYISPRSGKAASRAEAGAFLDRMIAVPGFFMGKKTANEAEIREGCEMTTMLLENFALPAVGLKTMPEERQQVIMAMDDVSGIAIFTHGDDENFDEDAYRRRLLSLRTLKIGSQQVSEA